MYCSGIKCGRLKRKAPDDGINKVGSILRKDVWSMWFKVVVACIPGAVVTIAFDDFIEAHLHTPFVIAVTLIVYGIAFIIIERWNKTRTPKVLTLNDITYKTALLIGLFQVLSIIPGTSRSGATIIGALLIGVSRVAAAEFTFFLAVPVMFGMSALKGKTGICNVSSGGVNPYTRNGCGIYCFDPCDKIPYELYQKTRLPGFRLVQNYTWSISSSVLFIIISLIIRKIIGK